MSSVIHDFLAQVQLQVRNTGIHRQIDLFIRSQHFIEFQFNMIVYLLREKIQLYQYIKNQQFSHLREFYKKVYRFSEKLLQTSEHFKHLWHNAKNQLNNKFLVFLYAEIYQYYLPANEYSIKQLKQDFHHTKDEIINLSQVNKEIVQFSVDFINNQGHILYYSMNAPDFFGYKKQDFKFIDNVNSLMPAPASKIHNQSIDEFLQTKTSTFLCAISSGLGLSQSGFIIPIKKCFSINTLDPTKVLAECFISLDKQLIN